MDYVTFDQGREAARKGGRMVTRCYLGRLQMQQLAEQFADLLAQNRSKTLIDTVRDETGIMVIPVQGQEDHCDFR